MISQSAEEVVGFRGLKEITRQVNDTLAAHRDDADALMLRGETRLHLGELELGLDDLRRSLEQRENPRAHQLMLDSLLAGLEYDFSRFRRYTPLIEKLTTTEIEELRYLHAHTLGLESVGDVAGAFRESTKIARLDTQLDELVERSPVHDVRRSRWVRQRLSELYRKGTADERAKMDAAAAAMFERVEKAGPPQRLQRFVECFAELPVADDARRRLIDLPGAGRGPSQVLMQLEALRASPRRDLAGFATARLAKLAVQQNNRDAAGPLLADLAETFSHDVCLNGQTGGALAREWMKTLWSQPAASEGPPAWPATHMVATRKQQLRLFNWPPAAVRIRSSPGPFFDGWNFQVEMSPPTDVALVARDETGSERWRIILPQLVRLNPAHESYYGYIHERLLVVALGSQMCAIDTLTPNRSPRVLWWRELFDVAPPAQQRELVMGQGPAVIPIRGGRAFIYSTDSRVSTIGEVGPVCSDYVCYRLGTTLYAVDPFTGALLWQRREIDAGSIVTGDNEHVVVIPRRGVQIQAIILRAADGEQVALRDIPRRNEWVHLAGKRLLAKAFDQNRGVTELQSIRLTDGSIIWRADLQALSRTCVIKGEELAILEPRGRLRILDLDTGMPLVDSPIEKLNNLITLHVLRAAGPIHCAVRHG